MIHPEQLPIICGLVRRRLAAGRPLGNILEETIERAINDNQKRADLPELRELLNVWNQIHQAG